MKKFGKILLAIFALFLCMLFLIGVVFYKKDIPVETTTPQPLEPIEVVIQT
jgi:hypothetical protein